MTDIVERLTEMAAWHRQAGHYDDSDGLLDAKAEIERLRQRVEELEGALRPFAQAARGPGQQVTARYPRPNDFRVALSLLGDDDES